MLSGENDDTKSTTPDMRISSAVNKMMLDSSLAVLAVDRCFTVSRSILNRSVLWLGACRYCKGFYVIDLCPSYRRTIVMDSVPGGWFEFLSKSRS